MKSKITRHEGNTTKMKTALRLLMFQVVLGTCLAGEFINGSFELPGITITNSQISFLPSLPVPDSLRDTSVVITNDTFVMPGWFKSGPGVFHWTNGRFDELNFNPVDGTHQTSFNGGDTATGGIISQTFDTTPGETYDVTFFIGRIAPGLGEVSITARVISDMGTNLAQLKVIPPASQGYSSASQMSFTATTTNSTLSFEDTSLATVSVDVSLDNVSVVPRSLEASVNMALYAGLLIEGHVGHLYRIDFSNDLNTNDWKTLTTISLPRSPYLLIDPTQPLYPKRFYRIVDLQ